MIPMLFRFDEINLSTQATLWRYVVVFAIFVVFIDALAAGCVRGRPISSPRRGRQFVTES